MVPAEYIDDPRTPDEAVLWRYINPEYIKDDGSVSSAAYKTRHLSAYVVALLASAGVTTAAALRAKFPGLRFQHFTAKAARSTGCIVARIPDAAGDDSHREICPAHNPHARLSKEGNKLRDAAAWVEGNARP